MLAQKDAGHPEGGQVRIVEFSGVNHAFYLLVLAWRGKFPRWREVGGRLSLLELPSAVDGAPPLGPGSSSLAPPRCRTLTSEIVRGYRPPPCLEPWIAGRTQRPCPDSGRRRAVSGSGRHVDCPTNCTDYKERRGCSWLFWSMAPAAAEASGSNGLMDAFRTNPIFLSINLGVSAIVVGMIAERAIFQLTKYRVNSKEFFAQIKKLGDRGQHRPRDQALRRGDYPTLQLVKAGLTHANKGPGRDRRRDEREDQRDQTRRRKAHRVALVAREHRDARRPPRHGARPHPHLRRRRCRRASPLRTSSSVLAAGIAEAMYNTAFGLGIAVTCMVAHLILHQRSKNIQHDLDATQERVFNLLTILSRPGAISRAVWGRFMATKEPESLSAAQRSKIRKLFGAERSWRPTRRGESSTSSRSSTSS